jgi:Mrp family chromosome partitioning ATPase
MEDPYSLFTSAAYGYLLIALKKKFDWIIIDTPSGMTYSEFPVIAKFIDGVIILTKYNNFKKRHLKNITNQFKDWDIAFLGSIIREELSQFKAKL